MLRSATWAKIDRKMAMRKMGVLFDSAGFDVSDAVTWAAIASEWNYLAWNLSCKALNSF